MQFGLDNLITSAEQQALLRGRIAYLGHAAAVSWRLESGLDELSPCSVEAVKAFGFRIMASVRVRITDETSTRSSATPNPVSSLYGATRKRTTTCWRTLTPYLLIFKMWTRVYSILDIDCFGGLRRPKYRVVVLDRPKPVGESSSKELPDPGWFSLSTWLHPHAPDDCRGRNWRFAIREDEPLGSRVHVIP
jgi:uncharacterized protein YbbC (DUF1343 family)